MPDQSDQPDPRTAAALIKAGWRPPPPTHTEWDAGAMSIANAMAHVIAYSAWETGENLAGQEIFVRNVLALAKAERRLLDTPKRPPTATATYLNKVLQDSVKNYTRARDAGIQRKETPDA